MPRTHSRSVAVSFFILLSAVLAFCPRASAQAVGEILGTVTDPTGGVIPNAKVTATRVETGISQLTVTSSGGTYTIPHLVVGTYNISVEASGFKIGATNGVTLDVAQQRQVDFKLSLSGVTAEVEVSAAPPLLNTTEGVLAGLVSGQQVQSLPLNGRSIANLVMLQPGMAQDTGEMGWFAPQWIGNGNRGETTVATLDGADATDREMGTIQFWDFNLDAIAEFKVQQNNYSAQYGQGGGTITQIVSKTGTNQFHGSVFEFLRNSAFDARNFFAYGANSVPPLQRNEFGGVFGGPLKKDKTFFFGEYAGFRQLAGEPTIVPVPTATERQGQVTIPDPVLSNFQDQLQVPLNSVAQGILGKYPSPNQPNGLYGPNTYNVLFKQPTNYNQFSVRLDQNFSEKDAFFARASYINHSALDTDALAAIEAPDFSARNVNNPRNYALSETHTFSPTLLNTASFTLNRQTEGSINGTQAYTHTSFSDNTLAGYGPDTFYSTYIETYFEPQDNLSWNKGRHSFNLGGRYERGWDNLTGVGSAGPNGIYTFSPGQALLTTIPSTNGGTPLAAGSASPSGMISFMEGAPSSYQRGISAPGFGPAGGGANWGGLRVWHLASYLQDDIRVTPKLTVNLGLRYEYNSVAKEVGNRVAVPGDYGNVYGRFVLNPEPFYKPDYPNFGPRLGIAERVSNKTVLRGGFGIFTNQIPTVYPDQTLTEFPMVALSYLYPSLGQPVPYSLSPLPVPALPPMVDLSGKVVPPNGNTKLIPPNTPVNLAAVTNVIGPISGWFASDRLHNGYTVSANATVEQELPGSVDFQVSYVTNSGVGVYNEAFPNAYFGADPKNTPYSNVNPGLTPGSTAINELIVIYNGAHSSYNGLQAQVRKNAPSHGIQFQANYTWSKLLTDADGVWTGPPSGSGVTLNNPQCMKCEYGPATYSVAQRFVANFQYSVPVPQHSFVPRRLVEGWKLLGIVSAQTGFPFTVVGPPYGTLEYGFDAFYYVGARPFNLKQATMSPTLKPGTGPQFFSNAVINDAATITNIGANGVGPTGTYFGVPQTISPYTGLVTQTAPGNLGRNTFTGPSWSNVDFSVIKDTRITENTSLQFRAEFFNVLNQATMGTPNGTIGNPTFGLITGTATPERQIQFGVRFIF